jgi:hypothetical protein
MGGAGLIRFPVPPIRCLFTCEIARYCPISLAIWVVRCAPIGQMIGGRPRVSHQSVNIGSLVSTPGPRRVSAASLWYRASR